MRIQLPRIRIERREDIGAGTQIAAVLLALAASLLVTAGLVRIAGADVREAFVGLFLGAFGDKLAIVQSLVKATPLILTGLATVVAFRGQMWNIGGEGQLYAGAIVAYGAYLALGWLPSPALIAAVMVFGLLGGALWGGLAGILKSRFKVDEVLSTIMLNYIISFVLTLLVGAGGPWIQPGQFSPQTRIVSEAARFPFLPGAGRIHIGFIVAVLAAVAVYFLIERTALGYEIRAFGANPTASSFKGIRASKMFATIMPISGSLAGLAGAGLVFGEYFRLQPGISPGYGFTGILVALLANLHPLGVVPAAILFGGLDNGAFRMQVLTGVPTALVSAIEAIIMLFFVGASAAVRFRIRRVPNAD
jgi:general nucleoside transport system permease protein